MSDGRRRGEHPAARNAATTDRVARLDGIACGGAEPTTAPVARLGELGGGQERPAGRSGPPDVPGHALPVPATPGSVRVSDPASGPATGPGAGSTADLGRIGTPDRQAAPVADLAVDAQAAPGAEPGATALFETDGIGAGRADVTVVDLDPRAARRAGRGRPGRDRVPGDRTAAGSSTEGSPRRKSRAGRGGGARTGGRTDGQGAAGQGAAGQGAGRRGAAGARRATWTDAAASDVAAPGAAAREAAGPDIDEPGGAEPAEYRDLDAGSRSGWRRAAGRSGGRRGTAHRPGSREELDPDADPVAVAREICLRLLTDRARTRQGLAQALHRRGVPDDAAKVVLERFHEVGLIDDAAFAGQWVRSRHTQRGLARRAIAVELRQKGVSEEDAGEALAEVDTASEEQRARELVDRKLRTLAVGTPEKRAAAGRRLVGMLARKGYGAGIAYRVVKEALAERGAEADELGDAEVLD